MPLGGNEQPVVMSTLTWTEEEQAVWRDIFAQEAAVEELAERLSDTWQASMGTVSRSYSWGDCQDSYKFKMRAMAREALAFHEEKP